MKKGKGLIDQIQGSNSTYGTKLTEKDIKKFMRDLSMQDYVKPRDKKTGRFLPGPKVKKKLIQNI